MSDAHLHRIHSDDDVAVTFSALKPGEFVELDDQRIQILGNVPKFHKVSIKPIMKGQKYVNMESTLVWRHRKSLWVSMCTSII